MSEKFKIGDVVWLKSGGPPMTIIEDTVAATSIVGCMWFNRADCLLKGNFLTKTLIRVKTKERKTNGAHLPRNRMH